MNKILEQRIESFVRSSERPLRMRTIYRAFEDDVNTKSDVLSAIWRLLDHHKITLDRDLNIVAVIY